MPWYYAKDGQRMGPYTDPEFSGMVSQGTISPDTLVWRDGMSNWLPLSQVQQPPSGPSPVAPSYAPSYSPNMATASDRPMVVCSSCHRAFPEDEVIQYQGAYICATCKPVFVQQLREGAHIAGDMRYGGFWIRFAARWLDGIILLIAYFILVIPMGIMLGQGGEAMARVAGALINLASIIIGMAYETFFIGKYGATPGKMACGLKVVNAEGESITFLRAFARYWATQLSSLTLLIGFIIAAFDSQKRALHDHICNTRVIRK